MQLIMTDEVFDLGDEKRAYAEQHRGHEPDGHICEGCEDPWENWCLAKKNSLETPTDARVARALLALHSGKGPQTLRVGDLAPDACPCQCHSLFWECTHAQTYLANDGRPLYQVEIEGVDNPKGIKIVVPFTVAESFRSMPEGDQLEAVRGMLAQAGSEMA